MKERDSVILIQYFTVKGSRYFTIFKCSRFYIWKVRYHISGRIFIIVLLLKLLLFMRCFNLLLNWKKDFVQVKILFNSDRIFCEGLFVLCWPNLMKKDIELFRIFRNFLQANINILESSAPLRGASFQLLRRARALRAESDFASRQDGQTNGRTDERTDGRMDGQRV